MRCALVWCVSGWLCRAPMVSAMEADEVAVGLSWLLEDGDRVRGGVDISDRGAAEDIERDRDEPTSLCHSPSAVVAVVAGVRYGQPGQHEQQQRTWSSGEISDCTRCQQRLSTVTSNSNTSST